MCFTHVNIYIKENLCQGLKILVLLDNHFRKYKELFYKSQPTPQLNSFFCFFDLRFQDYNILFRPRNKEAITLTENI